MSLVIASNQDNEIVRSGQSIFTPWSFRNALSSTYKIPPNSQVCLQSAKVNLDGRTTLEENNSIYYDWYGEDLDESVSNDIDFSTSYPIKQQFIPPRGGVESFTTDELAEQIKSQHREFHPNRMGHYDCVVKRTAGTGFLGFDFKYGFNACQTQNASIPTSIEPWNSGISVFNGSFSYNSTTGVYQRIENATTTDYPSVGILLDKPLSLSNGSMKVTFSNANASGVPWGVGLSRDCPNDFVNWAEKNEYGPEYFTHDYEIANSPMRLGNQSYYLDFGVHRNRLGELVVRQSSWDAETNQMMFSEVEYWRNVSSDLLAYAGRYDLSTNPGGYDWVEFRVEGEKVSLYIGHSGSTDLVCQVDTVSDKDTMFKPVSQTCWCLHPVLFVGKNGANTTNSLTLNGFSGLDIVGYDSRDTDKKFMGWFERLTSAYQPGGIHTPGGVVHCRAVDSRVANQPTNASIHQYTGLNASNIVDYSPAIITAPNRTYTPTHNAATSGIFGFIGRSLVNTGTYSTAGSIITLTFTSDDVPLTNNKSIFVRLNNFGQQVLNARTGNKSSILAHLPTAELKTGGLFFYEPNRDVWLDLNNPYEISVSDIAIDFVYSNEQYAENLQGQSIVVLYFRTPK